MRFSIVLSRIIFYCVGKRSPQFFAKEFVVQNLFLIAPQLK